MCRKLPATSFSCSESRQLHVSPLYLLSTFGAIHVTKNTRLSTPAQLQCSRSGAWEPVRQNATMCDGHGLYKQFTRLFLFLQKWVWLARLTAAVPASFRFQEFKSSKSSFDSEDVKSVMKMAN